MKQSEIELVGVLTTDVFSLVLGDRYNVSKLIHQLEINATFGRKTDLLCSLVSHKSKAQSSNEFCNHTSYEFFNFKNFLNFKICL